MKGICNNQQYKMQEKNKMWNIVIYSMNADFVLEICLLRLIWLFDLLFFSFLKTDILDYWRHDFRTATCIVLRC